MGLFDKILSPLGGDENTEESDADKTGSDPFSIPANMVEDKVKVSHRTEIISTHYDEITARQAKEIAQILEKHMTDPDGYRQREIRKEVEDRLELSEELAERIVWTESASIEICDTVQKYKGQMAEWGDEWVFKIPSSNDDRSHPIRVEAIEEIEERGPLPLDEVHDLLKRKAEKYQDEGGTPERMDHWVPHEKPRYTVVREVTGPE